MAKHCVHVAKSGMIFLACMSSAAWTTIIWPSSDGGMGLPFPFAGGSSAKSMYSLASTLAMSFLKRAGSPVPTVTSGAGGRELLPPSSLSSLLRSESICPTGSSLSLPSSLSKLWTPASSRSAAHGGSFPAKQREISVSNSTR